MRPVLLSVLLPALVVVLLAPSVGDAQQVVTTNITQTTGAGNLGTQILPPSGNVYGITGGKTLGTNLFHSFGEFSVGAGDIAQFQTSNLIQNASMSNILGRVTGGNPSNIFGTIDSATYYPSANLFLINPSGIVFGPNGSVNVGGSVSFTTAQYLRLFDGVNSANFYANPVNDSLANSVLAVAPVVDFGFLSPAAYGFLTPQGPNATITVQGSALSVPSGQSISLVGGKVVIEGATFPDGTVQRAQLSAPNGRILLASAASPGEFDATTLFPGLNTDSVIFTSSGSASLEKGSSIDVSGGQTVLVKGGQLVLSMNDATLNTSGSPAPPDTISLGPGSFILTSNSGIDSGVEVQLSASNIRMNGAFISTQTDGAEHGGDVTLRGDRVTLDQFSGIFTGTVGEGTGGNLTIQGTKEVVLSGGSQVATATLVTGASGAITITAESLDLNGASSVNTSTNGIGPNGDIVVSVRNGRLSGGANITSLTAFSGENAPVGGKITVQGLQGGHAESLSLSGQSLSGQFTGIISQTIGTSRLGDIEVNAKTVSLTGGAVIQAGTPLDTATSGRITIDADSVGISGGSRISSQAFGFDAGPVTITATHQFTLDHGSIETNTSSPTGGRGGDVVLNVGNASLTNGAAINSSSTGTGNAGNIIIKSASTFLMQNSSMTTAASQASGGQIKIIAPEMVRLINSNIITSVAGSGTDTFGGNISIDPQFVILQNSQILAQAFAGTGGKIDIISGVYPFLDPSSRIDASSTLGISGTVTIQSPGQNVGGQLTPLSQQFSRAAALLAQQCAARAADGKFSTFVVAGREGLPVEPGGFLASPSLTAELLGSSLSGRDRHTHFPAVTGAFQEYGARPIQLAKFGDACH